jgi:hypothetical protein
MKPEQVAGQTEIRNQQLGDTLIQMCQTVEELMT